jgi:xylan 1,4-beta-xylosidase
MGRPAYPTREQILALRRAARMAPPEHIRVHRGRFSLDVPPQGLAVVRLGAGMERQQ